MYLKKGNYYCFHPEILQSNGERATPILRLEGMFIMYSKNKKFAFFAKKNKFQLSFDIYCISTEYVISEYYTNQTETTAVNYIQLENFMKELEYNIVNEPRYFNISQIEMSNYFTEKKNYQRKKNVFLENI
jgi:hypothetical protein